MEASFLYDLYTEILDISKIITPNLIVKFGIEKSEIKNPTFGFDWMRDDIYKICGEEKLNNKGELAFEPDPLMYKNLEKEYEPLYPMNKNLCTKGQPSLKGETKIGEVWHKFILKRYYTPWLAIFPRGSKGVSKVKLTIDIEMDGQPEGMIIFKYNNEYFELGTTEFALGKKIKPIKTLEIECIKAFGKDKMDKDVSVIKDVENEKRRVVEFDKQDRSSDEWKEHDLLKKEHEDTIESKRQFIEREIISAHYNNGKTEEFKCDDSNIVGRLFVSPNDESHCGEVRFQIVNVKLEDGKDTPKKGIEKIQTDFRNGLKTGLNQMLIEPIINTDVVTLDMSKEFANLTKVVIERDGKNDISVMSRSSADLLFDLTGSKFNETTNNDDRYVKEAYSKVIFLVDYGAIIEEQDIKTCDSCRIYMGVAKIVFIMIYKDGLTDSNTIQHEAGHTFRLDHTFEKSGIDCLFKRKETDNLMDYPESIDSVNAAGIILSTAVKDNRKRFCQWQWKTIKLKN